MKSNALHGRLTLISHPATREQKAGIFPLDEPLDEQSLRELASAPRRVPRDIKVFAAPELRTRQTSDALGLNAIDDSELRDCDFGRWRGRSLEELQSEEVQSLIDWLNDIRAAPHEGESFYKLMTRVGAWLDRQRGAGPVVAVTHGSVIRAAVVYAMQGSPHQSFLRLEVSPLTMTDIRFGNGFWCIRSVGVPLEARSLMKSIW